MEPVDKEVVVVEDAPDDTSDEPDPTPPPEPEPAPEPEPEEPQVTTVPVPEAEILGKTEAQVTELLTGAALRIDAITGNIAPSQDAVGQAYRVNPTGSVAENTLIAVYFYAEIPSPPAPSAMVVTPAVGPYSPADEITLSWPAYAQCPSGFPVTNYILEIVGGTLIDEADATLGPNKNSVGVTLGDPGTLQASYVVSCSDINTPKSQTVSVTITDPDAGSDEDSDGSSEGGGGA